MVLKIHFLVTTEIKPVLNDVSIHIGDLVPIIKFRKWNIVRRWRFPFIRYSLHVQLRGNKKPSKKYPLPVPTALTF